MHDAVSKKLLLLIFTTSIVFATGKDHFTFSSQPIVLGTGSDLIFANGFEEPGAVVFTSDDVADISDVPAVEVDSELVGSISGSFQTDQMGQANYSMPLLTGAGTAGLAPQMSLNYSSGSGNGVVGVGWSLSGTTVITRCRETEESRDGASAITPQPISWDNTDKLCLNGERLYVVGGANYWDDGSTYRTERDQFARVTYSAGTDSFTIERKDGSIAYYGDTTDSAIAATDVSGTPVYAWAISRFKDNMNNYIDYTYQKLGNLEFVLVDVDYTGHIGDGTAQDPSLGTYNNLSFTYESTRTDKTVAYIAGAKVAMTQRLASVDSFIDDTNVRTYTLAYSNSSHSGRSIMTSVSECRAARCLPVTTFAWSQPDSNFKTTSTGGASFPQNLKSSKLGDINGDSRADLIFVDDNTNTFKVALANGSSGFTIATTTTISAPTGTEIDNKWHLIDFNADGRQDLLKQVGTSWVVYLALSGAIGFSSSSIVSGIPATTADSDFQIVDMNGDGLADLLYPLNGGLAVRYLEKDGSNGYKFATTAIAVDLPTDPNQIDGIDRPIAFTFMEYKYYQGDELNIRTQDVNGDGIADLILRTIVNEFGFLAQGQDMAGYKFTSTDGTSQAGGVTTNSVASTHWVAYIGKGLNNGSLDYSSENFYISTASLADTADKQIKFLDINADGLTDILSKGDSGDFWKYAIGTGTGFTPFIQLGTINNADYLQLFDHNSDGYIDLYYPSGQLEKDYYLRTWTGNGFSTAVLQNTKAINLTNNVNLFLDLNGDGREDQLRIDSGGIQRIYIREDTYGAVDKIVEITTGLNQMDAKTTISYQPITFSSAYIQGTGANLLNFGNNSPVFDYLSSLYVVNSVTTDTPTQSDATARTTMTYQYKDARVQTGGRGFLGFGEIITSVPVKGSSEAQNFLLQTNTTYNQEFPFIGLPKTVTVNQYEVSPTPPLVCNGDDSCFPPPCFPGETCNIIQKALNGAAVPTLLSETSNSFAKTITAGKSQFAYINNTIEKTYAPNGTGLLKTRVQSTSHDGFGNPLVNTVKIYDGVYDAMNPNTNLLHTTTTTNTYTNQTSNWKIGLLESTSTSVTRPSQAGVTTLSEYDYNLNTGLLKEERKNPSTAAIDAGKFLRIMHEYDNFGNETKTISCSGQDFTSTQCANTSTISSDIPDSANKTLIHRYNELIFDAKGRYANTIKNSLDQTVSSIISRDIYGNPITTTDLLGTTTTNSYGTFGTAQSSYSSLGSWTYVSKRWCSQVDADVTDVNVTVDPAAVCPANGKIRITKRASGGALSYGFIDKLGRTISTTARSFNAIDDSNTANPDERWIVNDQFFDNLGRAVTTVGPYFYGETNPNNIPTTSTEYDRYNRVTKVTLPDGATENISYAGFVATTTNALNQTKTETKNALGELIQAKDTLNNTLDYTYNAQGLVTEIHRTADGTTELLTKNSYDSLGRKFQSEDVDTGRTISQFNAEGEIISVIDAKLQHVNTYRDALGRVFLTENFDENSIKVNSTEQIYDANTNQITQEIEHLGADGFRRDYVYDNLKRLSGISTTFNDTENLGCGLFGLCSFESHIFYDQHSRSKIEQDASGKAIENHYNTQGYLERITDAANANKQYYQINATDNRGNIIKDTKADSLQSTYSFDKDRGFMTDITTTGLANNLNYNYAYDQLGNLIKRADINQNLSECFYYDNLNRLTQNARHSSFGVNCAAAPTPIESKSISYNGKGNITQKDGQTYSYLNANAFVVLGISPHQVQSKGNQVFTYDVNGNNTQMTNFQGKNGTFQTRHLEYNTFNKIQRMWTGNDSNNPIAEALYKYDTTRQKFARIDKEGTTEKVTYFIGNVEIEYNGGTVKYKRQLGNYAIITETANTTQEAYLFTDHLGSVDTITDKDGNILQKMSFSAWGERRLPANWNTMPLPTIRQQMDDYTNRGYTGHEMVDAFGIVNMNGRIYDAALGRMLQADPFVQDPTNTQSFNRYTYVFNNPLSYTDPSGYFSLRQTLGIVVGIALGIFNPFALNVFWSAFVAGFASSIIITGNLKTALISGLIAGSIAFVGDKLIPSKIKPGDGKEAAGGAGDVTTSGSEASSAPQSKIGSNTSNTTTRKATEKVAIQQSQQAASDVGTGILNGNYDIKNPDAFFDMIKESGVSGAINLDAAEQWGYQLLAEGTSSSVSWGKFILEEVYNQQVRNMATNNLNTFLNEIIEGALVASTVTGIAGIARGTVKFGLKKWAERTAAQRARFIHEQVSNITQSKTTIAVTNTKEGVKIISSSEKRLRLTQRRVLRSNEVEGIGLGHAEVTGINTAKELGLTPIGTAASRPICLACQPVLKVNNVRPLSPLKQ